MKGENLLDLMNITHHYVLSTTSVGSYARRVGLRSVMSLSVNLLEALEQFVKSVYSSLKED